MRHADWSSTTIAPLAPTQATRPNAGLGGGGAGFERLFSDVQGEVTAYIQHGDLGGDTGAASRLNAQAALLRLKTQGLTTDDPAILEGSTHTPQQQAFLDSIAPWAKDAAARLGVAPELVQAHAALESGWGQRPLRTEDGASSHNLFGIKAGAGWDGASSDSNTTEYVGGAAVNTRERFRAYPDAASAFHDYARLLLDNPRYRGALNTGSDAQAFAQGLARGGYATDPAYARKLALVANRLQGNTP